MAEQAQRRRLRPGRPQSVLIGGESGAGKTEAVKILLRYLCEHSPGVGGEPSLTRQQSVVERLVEMNPLLEAFGNAATTLNHNSSRFGKLITVSYATLRADGSVNHESPRVAGGVLSSYLLEKLRVVHHADGEGYFHIFYQMANGLDHAESRRLALNSTGPTCAAAAPPAAAKALTSAEGWRTTIRAASAVGLDRSEMSNVCELLAAAVHLREVRFTESSSPSKHAATSPRTSGRADTAALGGIAHVSHHSEGRLHAAASLLGVPLEALAHAVCTRVLVVHGQSLDCGRSGAQARASCDALTKRLYAMLFTWVVEQVRVSSPYLHSARSPNTPPPMRALLTSSYPWAASSGQWLHRST